jgi:hypothetical protein
MAKSKMEVQAKPHVLLEMILLEMKADCRFVAAWLVKAAEAEEFWSQALNDPGFSEKVLLLRTVGIPDLGACALEILGELEHSHLVVALDLYSDEMGLLSIEFTLLVRLGFFVCVEGSYRIAIPEKITLATVQQAALDVLSTADNVDPDEDVIEIYPERLLKTLPQKEAKAWRSLALRMRRFQREYSAKVRRLCHPLRM